MTDRLSRQIAFVEELDRLKAVQRRTSIGDGSRLENSAEHSWQIATMAPLLAEHAPPGVDVCRVVRMLLIHDVVEIDAGDTFAYDAEANTDREQRERAAAERLFGLLPPDQGDRLRALWEEFEEGRTADARYAVSMDRLQGLLQNRANGGGTWRQYGVTRAQILERMDPVRTATPSLWPFVLSVIAECSGEGG